MRDSLDLFEAFDSVQDVPEPLVFVFWFENGRLDTTDVGPLMIYWTDHFSVKRKGGHADFVDGPIRGTVTRVYAGKAFNLTSVGYLGKDMRSVVGASAEGIRLF